MRDQDWRLLSHTIILATNNRIYNLHIAVENCENGALIYGYCPDKFRTSFRNINNPNEECDRGNDEKNCYKLITQNPYMEVSVKINKNLFKNGDKFRILAAAVDGEEYSFNPSSDSIFGVSQEIS